VHPLLRFYVAWLHAKDPGRFSVERLAERYGLKPRTVAKLVRNDEAAGISRSARQVTKEQKIALAKEREFAKRVGYELLGSQDVEDERNVGEDFAQGISGTSDYVRLQQIEVENFSAFPITNKRNPVPKRVDVDVLLLRDKTKKVVNWVDPNDKLVF
jgi:hypothetical protein